MSHPVLVFDFDGTVALGHGPVLAYAAAVARAAGQDGSLVDRVRQMLFTGTSLGTLDAYDLVAKLAVEAGADQSALEEGYRVSRAGLGTDEVPIEAPQGLAEFLARTPAERILITNAPETRLDEALEKLGLTGYFDRVIHSGGKPAGLERLLDELLADGPRPILCVGDIWANDLAPAHVRGLTTVLVGGWGSVEHPATHRVEDLSTFLPQLRAWVDRAGVDRAGVDRIS